MGEGQPCVNSHFSNQPSPSGGRDSSRSEQGEGLSRRGKTPELLLERARRLRAGQTEAEDKLWSRLRAGRLHGLKFRRQIAFSANYVADFVHPKSRLIIELDGSQHADQAAYDERRTRFFESQGYRVIRFWNNEVFENMDGVLTAIYHAVSHPLPGAARLSLPPEGEGR
jgi:very-short-patch-repair endonuclease